MTGALAGSSAISAVLLASVKVSFNTVWPLPAPTSSTALPARGSVGEAVVSRIGPRTANDAVLARQTLGVLQRRVECPGIDADAVDALRGC
jgi:hypothetical protein